MLSCSHVKSGHYVQVLEGDDLEKLSKEFDVPLWAIQEANEGKRFRTGEWFFIPLKRGLVSTLDPSVAGSRVPSSGMSGEGFMWPVPSSKKISSGYGRRWGRIHTGIDISGRIGGHIVATQNGVVVYSGSEYGGFGKIIVISHSDGLFSIYAHNNKNYVRKGQRVYRGQVIAQLGNTGRSTGPHLHFEIRKNGNPYDPMLLLTL